jgi:hypothetical protein
MRRRRREMRNNDKGNKNGPRDVDDVSWAIGMLNYVLFYFIQFLLVLF